MAMAEVKLDPARYEVFYRRLDSILNEGKEVIRYLSGSVITREAGEVLEAFYLPTGEAVDIACGILMHFLNVPRVIKYMHENRYAEDVGIYDGDQFINNDAYIGGMHVPDTSVVAPFVYHGEHFGFVAAISHTTEVGGIDPGGMCPSATEACHDGLHLPAVKLVEKGKWRRDLFNMILRAVREPRGMELDIKARIAGNERVKQRLTEMVDEFGVDFFKQAARQLVKDGAAQSRVKIKGLRPGMYSSRMYCDALGMGREKIAVIQLDMEITEEGEMIMSMPVISPQSAGFNNCYLPAIEATTVYTLLTQLFWDIRWNSGIMEPVRIEAPEKSLMNADATCSVGYCTVGAGMVYCNALTDALSRAYFVSGKEEEVQAAPTTMNFAAFGGIDQFGRTFGNLSITGAAAGAGARIGKDGIDQVVCVFNPWHSLPDREGEEMIMPILHLVFRYRPNSGGFGKYRGGLGTANLILIHKTNVITGSAVGVGGKVPVHQGLFGGYPGPTCFTDIVLNSDFYERVKQGKSIPTEFPETGIDKLIKGDYIPGAPNVPSRPLKSGDLLATVSGAGGGGLGDPIERDPDRIVEEIKDTKATLPEVQKVYCVSIDPETLEIDHEKTAKMREEKKRQRLSQGVPAKDFLKVLVEKRRDRKLPKVAQDFLDETLSFSSVFRDHVEAEEKLLKKDLEPLKKVRVKSTLFKLTPYVNIVEDETGKKVAICSNCGFAYCDARENFKLYCLVYERDPAEIQPGNLTRDNKDWCIYREFYCPGCGTQVEVEATPPGTPILNNYTLKI